MANTGWEIRPAGWILLIVLALVLVYFLNQRLRRGSGDNPQ